MKCCPVFTTLSSSVSLSLSLSETGRSSSLNCLVNRKENETGTNDVYLKLATAADVAIVEKNQLHLYLRAHFIAIPGIYSKLIKAIMPVHAEEPMHDPTLCWYF